MLLSLIASLKYSPPVEILETTMTAIDKDSESSSRGNYNILLYNLWILLQPLINRYRRNAWQHTCQGNGYEESMTRYLYACIQRK